MSLSSTVDITAKCYSGLMNKKGIVIVYVFDTEIGADTATTEYSNCFERTGRHISR